MADWSHLAEINNLPEVSQDLTASGFQGLRNTFGTHFVIYSIQAISIIYLIHQGSQVKSLAFIILSEFLIADDLPYLPYCFRGTCSGFFSSLRNYFRLIFVVRKNLTDPDPDGCGELYYIFTELLFQLSVPDLTRGMFFHEILNC
jgi:hypothetical protein